MHERASRVCMPEGGMRIRSTIAAKHYSTHSTGVRTANATREWLTSRSCVHFAHGHGPTGTIWNPTSIHMYMSMSIGMPIWRDIDAGEAWHPPAERGIVKHNVEVWKHLAHGGGDPYHTPAHCTIERKTVNGSACECSHCGCEYSHSEV